MPYSIRHQEREYEVLHFHDPEHGGSLLAVFDEQAGTRVTPWFLPPSATRWRQRSGVSTSPTRPRSPRPATTLLGRAGLRSLLVPEPDRHHYFLRRRRRPAGVTTVTVPVRNGTARRGTRALDLEIPKSPVVGEARCAPDPAGGWLILIPALVAAGLLDRTTPPDTRDTRVGSAVGSDMTPSQTLDVTPGTEVAGLRDQLAAAEQRVLVAVYRAEVAEAIAEERGRTLEFERQTLRMLTQAPY